MPLFVPDTVLPGDPQAFGRWLTGHYYEHRQFVQIGLQNSPIIVLQDYDLWAWNYEDERAKRDWLNAHQAVHQRIRFFTNIEGFNLADVDLDNDGDFLVWQDAHAFEHSLIRKAFNIT